MLDLRLLNSKCGIIVDMCTRKKKSQARAEGVKTISVRNIKKQEQGVPVGQPFAIWARARNPIADGYYKYILYIYIYIYVCVCVCVCA